MQLRTLTGLVVALAEPGVGVDPEEPVLAVVDGAGAEDVAGAAAPGVYVRVLFARCKPTSSVLCLLFRPSVCGARSAGDDVRVDTRDAGTLKWELEALGGYRRVKQC
jgi:hypothetical protein